MFVSQYADVFAGDERWKGLQTPEGNTFEWDEESTYVRKPPYFEGMTMELTPVKDITARVLAKLGDLGDDRPHQPGRPDQGDSPAVSTCRSTGRQKDFNLYGRGAATTR